MNVPNKLPSTPDNQIGYGHSIPFSQNRYLKKYGYDKLNGTEVSHV